MVDDGVNWRMTDAARGMALSRWRCRLRCSAARRLTRKASCARPASTSTPRDPRASIRPWRRGSIPNIDGRGSIRSPVDIGSSPRATPTATTRSCASDAPDRCRGRRFPMRAIRPTLSGLRRRLSRPTANARSGRSSSAGGGGNGAVGQEGQRQVASNAPPQAAIDLRAIQTNSWPRSTARCRTRRPMSWRGVTAWSGSQSQNFPLIGGTIGLFRIIDRRAGGHSAPRTSPPTPA